MKISTNKTPSSLFKIRFNDCDMFGHLNNARFIDYLINARQDHLKEHYDFIILYDVIEHIENVNAFLEASIFHLKPGGWVFINVPALKEIYSNYDKFVGHLRRYDKNMMAQTIKEAGLKSICINFWGFSFLPLLWARIKFLSKDNQMEVIVQKGFNPQSSVLNDFLKAVISIEVSVFPFPPVGTSIMAIAQKPK